jgi:hypothetical protein
MGIQKAIGRQWGFRKWPFSTRPDGKLFCAVEPHATAFRVGLDRLLHRRTCCLVLGGRGSGRSSLLLALQRALAAHQLEAPCYAHANQAGVDFVGRAPKETMNGESPLLLDDVPHHVLLSAIRKPLQLPPGSVLVGPLLGSLLEGPALKSDYLTVVQLRPWSPEEAAEVIRGRLTRCGGTGEIFEPHAMRLLWEQSAGHPRRLITLAGWALVVAAQQNASVVQARHMQEAYEEVTQLPQWLVARSQVEQHATGARDD